MNYVKKNMISKNKVILFCYIFYVLLVYWFMQTIKNNDFNNWIMSFFIVCILSLIVQICILKKLNIKLFSLTGMFLVFSYLFHFGQVPLYCINYDFKILNLLTWGGSTLLCKALEYSLFICLMMFVGVILTAKKTYIGKASLNVNTDLQLSDTNNLKRIGFVLLALTLPIELYLKILLFVKGTTYGYLQVFSNPASGVSTYFGSLYLVAVFLLMIAYKDKIIIAKAIYILTFLLNSIYMLSGSRSTPLITILIISFFYIRCVSKFSFKLVLKVVIGGLLLLFLLNVIRDFRTEGINNFNIFRNYNNNIFLSFFEEMGSTLYSVIIPIKNVSEPALGATYLKAFSEILINFGGTLNNWVYSSRYMNNFYGLSGYGGSFIGELYYNFLQYGIFVSPLIGIFINSISNKIEKSIELEKYYDIAMLFPVFSAAIWWNRDYFASFIRPLFWTYFIIWLLKQLLLKKVAKVTKNNDLKITSTNSIKTKES